MQMERDWLKVYNFARKKSSKRFWQFINKINAKQNQPRSNAIPGSVWVSHVSSLYNVSLQSRAAASGLTMVADEPWGRLAPSNSSQVQPQRNSATSTNSHPSYASVKIIRQYIGKIKSDGAPGPNVLPAGVFKCNALVCAGILSPFFNICVKSSAIPESWHGYSFPHFEGWGFDTTKQL